MPSQLLELVATVDDPGVFQPSPSDQHHLRELVAELKPLASDLDGDRPPLRILRDLLGGAHGARRLHPAAAPIAESPLVTDFGVFAILGSLGLIVALIATGMAMKSEAGAPTSVAVLLGISGCLITSHPPPFGPTGLALFIVAVLLLVRSQSAAPAPAPQTARLA
jgi:hypothetical protein